MIRHNRIGIPSYRMLLETKWYQLIRVRIEAERKRCLRRVCGGLGSDAGKLSTLAARARGRASASRTFASCALHVRFVRVSAVRLRIHRPKRRPRMRSARSFVVRGGRIPGWASLSHVVTKPATGL